MTRGATVSAASELTATRVALVATKWRRKARRRRSVRLLFAVCLLLAIVDVALILWIR